MIRVHLGHQLPDGFPSPDVYFLPGYGRAAGVADDGEWVLFEAHDGNGAEKILLLGKMIIRRAVAHPGAARHLPERERPILVLGDQLQRRFD